MSEFADADANINKCHFLRFESSQVYLYKVFQCVTAKLKFKRAVALWLVLSH